MWNPRERELVRASLPSWLLRLRSGPIQLGHDLSGSHDRPRLTATALERHGPGLLADFTTPSGERVLVWAE